MWISFLYLLSLFLPQSALGQTAIQTLARPETTLTELELFEEKIERIAPTKRVWILTNSNNALDKGDFITMLYKKQPFTRAVVAKNIEGQVGIKILKIYSLKLWNAMNHGVTVQILRGDDSGLSSLLNKQEEKVVEGGIQSEDDLYNDENLLNDELESSENDKRRIKTDNLLTLSIGKITASDAEGESASYTHWGGAWAYQLFDNIYAELSAGQSILKGYPNDTLDTTLTSVTIRGKYTFTAPLDSYFQPYTGLLFVSASSPSAGDGTGTSADQEELDAEVQAVESLNKKGQIIFGVSILKRLVPGWFAKLDLGTDIMNLGMTVEF